MCFCFEMFSLSLLIGVNIIKVICNCFFFFFCYFSFSFTIWKIICNFYNFRFISINLWYLLDLKYFRCSWYGSDFWYFWLIFIVFEESIRFIDVWKIWVLSWIGVAWCLIWREWLIGFYVNVLLECYSEILVLGVVIGFEGRLLRIGELGIKCVIVCLRVSINVFWGEFVLCSLIELYAW